MTYNTKQKDLILEVIKDKNELFTLKNIYNELDKKVGLTTIYRLVDKLVEEGKLTKTIGKDSSVYYQYFNECDKDNHFYLKCDLCGKIEHIDCDCITDLSNHIVNNHKFRLNKEHIIIDGICNKCHKENFAC